MFRLYVSLVLCACTWACASSGDPLARGQASIESAAPGRVTLVDYRTKNRLTLVNEAHTDPTSLYSEKRSDASTKVTSNEVFRAMVGYFEEEGFFSTAASGFAPISGGESLRKALEIETKGGVRYIALDTRDISNYETLQSCTTAFIQIYNMTDQNQAVTNDSGKALFEEQQQELYDNLSNKDRGMGLK
ncbi:MAG: hypothetical protein ACI9F9_002931 [Candidatus Paceibacteria bacterium]|jgi:hypothetical protein